MIVSLSAGVVNKLQGIGRLRVGYVSCRLRIWEDRGKGRCPKCLVVGHARTNYSGPDRSECCRACGKIGHFVVNCVESEAVRASFQEELARTPKVGRESSMFKQ